MTDPEDSIVPAPLDGLIMQVFEPPRAAEILRGLGLTGMTEIALRHRAYRRQVPFHRNGNKITFTLDDLKEIAEGQASRPEPRERQERRHSGARRQASRADSASRDGAWRARRSFNG
jgi:hypothetical protein